MKKVITIACVLLVAIMFSPAMAEDGRADRLNRQADRMDDQLDRQSNRIDQRRDRQGNRLDERLGKNEDRTNRRVDRNIHRGDRRFDDRRTHRELRGLNRYSNRSGYCDHQMQRWNHSRYREHMYSRYNDRYRRHMYSRWDNRHHRNMYSHRSTHRNHRYSRNW